MPRPPRRALALLAVVALAGCGGPHRPPDRRGEVSARIAAAAAELVTAGYAATAPAARIGSCHDRVATVTWQAAVPALRAATGGTALYELGQNVISRVNLRLAHTELAYHSYFSAEDVVPGTVTYRTRDASTTLVVTVPGGHYVRIDGVVSCQ